MSPSDLVVDSLPFDELLAGRSAFYGHLTFVDTETVRVDEVYAEAIPLGDIAGRSWHVNVYPGVRDQVAGLDQADVIAYVNRVEDGFPRDHVGVAWLVDEQGRPVPLDTADGFDLVTSDLQGSGHDLLVELFHHIAAGDFYSVRTTQDPVATWMDKGPEARALDSDTPPEILGEYTTATTIAVDLPDEFWVGPGATSQDLTILEIYDPEFASVLSVAMSAGGYFGTVYVPKQGQLMARILSERTGQVSQAVPLDSLLEMAAEAQGDDVPTVVVTDHGYDPDLGNVDALTISVRTGPIEKALPHEWADG